MRALWLLLVLSLARRSQVAATSDACPSGMTVVDTFKLSSAAWTACEDLQRRDGAIALVSEERTEWFAKGHEEYADPSAVEAQYYYPDLGLNKTTVIKDSADVLAQTILSKNFTHVTWELV
eukprot:COSAG02_NODE_34299_length_486_cov_0.803618_1_plen_120_part_10